MTKPLTDLEKALRKLERTTGQVRYALEYQNTAITQAHAAGASLRTIAQTTGLSHETIRTRLNQNERRQHLEHQLAHGGLTTDELTELSYLRLTSAPGATGSTRDDDA